jgi:hypothetical protein
MKPFKPRLPLRKWMRHAYILVLAVLILTGIIIVHKPLPEGINFTGPWRKLSEVSFLRDITYVDQNQQRHHDQQIMDAMLSMIAESRSLLVLDQFLFNTFTGKESSIHRPLSSQLTQAVIQQKQAYPELATAFITDPINTLYGGLPCNMQQQLDDNDIQVIQTRLTKLRDSNPTYSVLWRLFLRFYPKSIGPMLPNPMGDGKVPLQSYLTLLNFKANHRKTLIADQGNELWGMVSSANPHDASSAHHNIAIVFQGPLAWDLLQTEEAVANFSDGTMPKWPHRPDQKPDVIPSGSLQGRIVTERAIQNAALEIINTANTNDKVLLAMFYLSSRPIVRSLLRAQERGVKVRVILDANKDAFGREKNGIPNRPVAIELNRAGIPVRWARTHGEQFHSKILSKITTDGKACVLAGSANYTRRNLKNFNLETCVQIRGNTQHPFFQDVGAYFEQIWGNTSERTISTDFSTYATTGQFHYWLYRIQEATGLSTF